MTDVTPEALMNMFRAGAPSWLAQVQNSAPDFGGVPSVLKGSGGGGGQYPSLTQQPQQQGLSGTEDMKNLFAKKQAEDIAKKNPVTWTPEMMAQGGQATAGVVNPATGIPAAGGLRTENYSAPSPEQQALLNQLRNNPSTVSSAAGATNPQADPNLWDRLLRNRPAWMGGA